MSDAPIIGTRTPPPENEGRPDGVVLFDPTPREPLPDPEAGDEAPRWSPVVFILLLVAVGAGGYLLYPRSADESAGGPPVVVEPQPASRGGGALIPLSGGGLVGPVGGTLPLELRAVGSGGVPLADTVVRITMSGLAAELGTDMLRTDAEGVARATIHLPRFAGRGRLLAEVVGSDLRAEVLIVSRAGEPARIAVLNGNGQQAEAGELLPERLAVVVTDRDGNPVPGVDIGFEIRSGDGVVGPQRVRTDSLGIASALWRLGPVPGTQEVRATALDLGSSATFTATALARLAVGLGTGVTVPPVAVRVEPRASAIGGSHVCVLVAGSARCRGANDRGQSGTGALAPAAFVALATGISHTCALDETGLAMCWGANNGGQLGDGSRTDRSSPVPVRTELRFSALTAGATHTCGLAAEGLPVCWGENLSGQLGDGTRTDARFPRAVGGGLSFTSLVAGWSHTCGLTANGNAFCWGLNSDGQLGDGSRLDRLVPTLVRGSIDLLAAGSAHTCGISGAQVLCWGDNRFGQLGDGTTEGRTQPVAVQGLPTRPRQVVAGAVHTCALLSDGSAYCWGQNLHGQLGDGTTQNRTRATPVSGGLRFRSIEAGGALTCGSAEDGAEYCWGLNQSGQLGDGTRESRSVPTRVTR
jgi:hypothetical protein